MFLPILFFLTSMLTISTGSETTVLDFCVGNSSAAEGPAGYSCKNAAGVTVDDFVFAGVLNKPVVSSPIFNAALTVAFDEQFPAVNGLGISANYVEIYQGGVVPFHTHPRGSELSLVLQGRIVAGFITTDNKVYYKNLNAGDLMVVPQGLLHFQQNAGNNTAKVFVSYSSSNPGIQLLPVALFGTSLPSVIVEKVSLLDAAEVKKLKVVFGGTN